MVMSINYILSLLDPHRSADQEILRPPYMRPKNGERPINEMGSAKFYEQPNRMIYKKGKC
jgi:GT2 family glycosyltransferase